MPQDPCFCCGRHATTAVACPGNPARTARACPDCTAAFWWHFCGCCPVRPHCTNESHVAENALVVTFGKLPKKPTPKRFRDPGVRLLDPWGVRRFAVPRR